MSSEKPEKWQEKVDINYEELFNPVWFLPHQGIVKIARELEKELGRKKAHQLVSRCANELGTSKMETAEGSPEEIVQAWRRGVEPTDPLFSHALNTKFEDISPTRFKMQVFDCLWAKTFKELKAPDIGYLWECNVDFALTKAFHPNLRLKRTSTIMQGDDCCEFTWYWEEE